MKARRILAVILSAAIFLCNVPITALAEELKEPPIQEANVIEEEPIAEDVNVENTDQLKQDEEPFATKTFLTLSTQKTAKTIRAGNLHIGDYLYIKDKHFKVIDEK